MKNNADAIIFQSAICAEASQISFDATEEIALQLSTAHIPSLRFGKEMECESQ